MRALHPDAAKLLAMMRKAGRPAFEQLSPETARATYAETRAAVQMPEEATAETEEFVVAGPGSDLRVRLHRGAGTGPTDILPCLLYLHGGGWVIGDLDSHDGICRRLANEGACCVVAVDYRLAPEHPFPAAVDDSAATLAWIVANASRLRIDPACIAVGGDSAGGNLAAVLALMGRDGHGHRLVFQLLFYPAVDLVMTSDSYDMITQGVPLTADTMRYFIDHYAPDRAHRTDWRASPLRAASLSGTPPALVVTAGHDPLCAEGRAYAKRLESEGVRVMALHYSDEVHGMLTLGGIIEAAAPLLRLSGAALRDAWRTSRQETTDMAA